MAEEKTLRLQIKREHLDKILSGEKTEEFRDVTDFYISRLCELDKDGNPQEDPNNPGGVLCKQYETVTFVSGYKKNAAQHVFKIERIAYEEWVDEKGNPIPGDSTFTIYLGERIS